MRFATEGELLDNSLPLKMLLFSDSVGNMWCVLHDTFYPAGLAPAVAETLVSPLGFNHQCETAASLHIKKRKIKKTRQKNRVWFA